MNRENIYGREYYSPVRRNDELTLAATLMKCENYTTGKKQMMTCCMIACIDSDYEVLGLQRNRMAAKSNGV